MKRKCYAILAVLFAAIMLFGAGCGSADKQRIVSLYENGSALSEPEGTTVVTFEEFDTADGQSEDSEDRETDAAESSPGSEWEEPLYEGVYTSKEDVSLYIHVYGCLPGNFMTKKEAEALGWQGGSLEPYAPGMCIGGSTFGNYEGYLPEKEGRTYRECDIDTLGADTRGAKRLVYSNDGLIYYTEDHYQSFELLFGEE